MIPLEHTAQVWGIYGNLGGGKTMTAVSMAVNAIRHGYYVVSNITIDVKRLQQTCPGATALYQHIVVRDEQYDADGNLISAVDFNPFTIPSGSPRGTNGGKRVLVILDECAEWFDQYSNLKSRQLSRVMSWLRHSSKRSQDVVFIVQRREYLNKSFRILVSRWVSVDDLAVMRLPIVKIHPPFLSPYVMAVVYDKAGNMIQQPKLISKAYYGQYYDTAECLSTFGGASLEYNKPSSPARSYLWLLLSWVASFLYLLYFSLC